MIIHRTSLLAVDLGDDVLTSADIPVHITNVGGGIHGSMRTQQLLCLARLGFESDAGFKSLFEFEAASYRFNKRSAYLTYDTLTVKDVLSVATMTDAPMTNSQRTH